MLWAKHEHRELSCMNTALAYSEIGLFFRPVSDLKC
jgi:hypothetical protein